MHTCMHIHVDVMLYVIIYYYNNIIIIMWHNNFVIIKMVNVCMYVNIILLYVYSIE